MLNKPTAHRINRFRSLFFQIGLVTALIFVAFAFEWKAPVIEKNNDYLRETTYIPPDDDKHYEIIEHKKKVVIKKATIKKHIDPIYKETKKEIKVVDPEPIEVLEKTEPITNLPPAKPQKEMVIEKEAPKPAPPIETVSFAEVMPQFPGGDEALMKYLSSTKYCKMDKKLGREGKVVIGFILNEFGKPTNVKILNGVSNCLNQKAVDKIKAMPKWEPGKQGEHVVRTKMTVAFKFQLR